MDSAGEASSHTPVAGCVLQTETGLVSLGDLLSGGGIQQVVVTEGLHAVVVPEDTHNVLVAILIMPGMNVCSLSSNCTFHANSCTALVPFAQPILFI